MPTTATLREKMYRAYGTRASEFGKPEWDNTTLMDEIVKLRGEEAHLLGFANYGELSLASKMANSPQQVVDFMRELAKRARPFAERDLAELREFARTELGIRSCSPGMWAMPAKNCANNVMHSPNRK